MFHWLIQFFTGDVLLWWGGSNGGNYCRYRSDTLIVLLFSWWLCVLFRSNHSSIGQSPMVHAQCTVKTDVKFIQRLVSQYSSIYNLNGYVNHTLISFRLVLRFCVEVSYHVYRPDSCFTSKLMKHSCFLTIFIASHTSVQLYPTLLYIIWLLKSSLKWFVNIDWEWVMNLWLNCFISDYLLLYGCF